MITPEYCVTMARYNQWQNNSLRGHVDAVSEDELNRDRGAFFGSILATLDHILWGDLLWLNRLDPRYDVPEFPAKGAPLSAEKWSADRAAFDTRLIGWAEGLSAADVEGEVVWTSKILGKTFTNPRGIAITHMFNHQTHHRGQVHAMLTAMGRETMDTDLVLMPES